MEAMVMIFGMIAFMVGISMAVKLGTYKFEGMDDVPYKIGMMFFGALAGLMFHFNQILHGM